MIMPRTAEPKKKHPAARTCGDRVVLGRQICFRPLIVIGFVLFLVAICKLLTLITQENNEIENRKYKTKGKVKCMVVLVLAADEYERLLMLGMK